MKDVLHCYTRVSTDKQEKEGTSLVVQEELGIEVSKKLGMKFNLYNEGSRSSTIHYREKLQQLQEDIKSGIVKNIWVQDRSRLFRDMIEGVTFRNDYLEKYNVTLYEGSSPNKLEFNSEDERLIYDLITRIQQSENIKRSEKSKIGKLRKLRKESSSKPIFLGGTPLFGYQTVERMWKVQKDEMKWVKFIFDSYEKGLSTRDIKIKLDREGVSPRRTSSGLWNIGTLQSMLRNKSYTGLHQVNEYRILDIDKVTKKKTKEIVKSYNYKIPKIINVGQFNRVNKLLDLNHKNKSNNKQHFSLLDGLLVCECGSKIGSIVKVIEKKNVNTRKYYCLSGEYSWKSNNPNPCKNKMSCQMDKTNNYVLESVMSSVQQSNILKERFKTDVMNQKKSKEDDIKKHIKFLENKCQSIQKIIDELENNIVDLELDKTTGKRDKNVVDKIIQRMEVELENQNKTYQEVESEIENVEKDKEWLDWVSKYGERIKLNTSSEKKQKEFLNGVVEKIVVKSDIGQYRNTVKQIGHKLEIHYKLKIVDDKIVYKDENKKSLGYEVIEGSKIEKGDTQRFVTSRSKKKSEFERIKLNHQLNPISNSRIDLTGDLTHTDYSTGDLKNKYTNYLCFTITYRTNQLVHYQNDKYSNQQKENHDLIKSLHDDGLGYRKISKILNDKGIKTSRGNTWTNTKVFSVLKKYKEREDRLELINKEYEPEWGKFEVRSERNY